MLPTRQLCGTTSTLAYLVLLRVEIARFTLIGSRSGWLGGSRLRVTGSVDTDPTVACATAPRTPWSGVAEQTRLCCSDPHLAVGSR